MNGIAFIVASVLLQSFVLSTISFTLDKQGVLSFSALSFFLCSSVFLIKLYFFQEIRIDRIKAKALLKLNLYTVLAFFPFHVALFFLPASKASLIEVSIAIFTVSLLTKEKKSLFLQACIIVAITGLFITIDQELILENLYGFLLSAAAGCGAALVSINSGKDYKGCLSTDEILAFRFIVPGGVALFFATLGDQDIPLLLTNYRIILFAFIGFVIPFYLLQRGMELSEPIVVVCSLAIIPITSYAFESLFYQRPSTFEASLMVTAVVMIVKHAIESVRSTPRRSNKTAC